MSQSTARNSTVHLESDTFAFLIATHGHEGLEHGQEIHDYVSATDVRMDTSDIMNKFGDETCPGLRGKPRLFFFQVLINYSLLSKGLAYKKKKKKYLCTS